MCEGRPRPPGPPGPPYLQEARWPCSEVLPQAVLPDPCGLWEPARPDHCHSSEVPAPSTPAHLPGEGSRLPGGEAPATIHPLLHVALAGAAFTKCWLSQALRGAQGRAAARHARHC